MSDTVIRVYVYGRNEKPLRGASVTWTVKHSGHVIRCGPATTQGFADKPVDIQIEGQPDDPIVEITAEYRGIKKTDFVPIEKRDHTIKLDVEAPGYLQSPPPPEEPLPQPSTALGYALLSLGGLGASGVVGWYLLNNPGLLAAGNASAQAYYFLLVLLGLSSAAFLFGAMRSTARLTGSHFGAAYDFGGPVVVAIVVVLGGFYLTKAPDNFVLAVRLRATEPINKLENTWVRVDLGLRNDRVAFSSIGDAIVAGVPSSYFGAEIPLVFESNSYALKDPKPTYKIPTNTVIYLDVVPMPTPPPAPQRSDVSIRREANFRDATCAPTKKDVAYLTDTYTLSGSSIPQIYEATAELFERQEVHLFDLNSSASTELAPVVAQADQNVTTLHWNLRVIDGKARARYVWLKAHSDDTEGLSFRSGYRIKDIDADYDKLPSDVDLQNVRYLPQGIACVQDSAHHTTCRNLNTNDRVIIKWDWTMWKRCSR
jgi:hypothetical protein